MTTLKNVCITLTAEGSYSIDDTVPQNEIDFEKMIHSCKKDCLFIQILQGIREGSGPDDSMPVEYVISDMRTHPKLLSVPTTVVTDTRYKTGSALSIITPINTVEKTLHREPTVIARILKDLEQRYVSYNAYEKSIFATRLDSTIIYFGFIFLLYKLGAAERKAAEGAL